MPKETQIQLAIASLESGEQKSLRMAQLQRLVFQKAFFMIEWL